MVNFYRLILFGNDIKRLADFYCKHFQFEIIEAGDELWKVLQNNSMQLALHKIGVQYQQDIGGEFKVESNCKLIFRIDESIADFRSNLLANGAAMQEIKILEGYPNAYCDGADPEGNMFQLEQIIST